MSAAAGSFCTHRWPCDKGNGWVIARETVQLREEGELKRLTTDKTRSRACWWKASRDRNGRRGAEDAARPALVSDHLLIITFANTCTAYKPSASRAAFSIEESTSTGRVDVEPSCI